MIVLNFSTAKVQKTFYDNILLKCEKSLNIFALTFFILVIRQFDTFFVPMSYTLIFIMFLTPIFIVFVALIFNIYIKVFCIKEIFIRFLFNISDFLGIIFRIFYCFGLGVEIFCDVIAFMCFC